MPAVNSSEIEANSSRRDRPIVIIASRMTSVARGAKRACAGPGDVAATCAWKSSAAF